MIGLSMRFLNPRTEKELEEPERYEMTIQDQRGAISLAEKKAALANSQSIAINLLKQWFNDR